MIYHSYLDFLNTRWHWPFQRDLKVAHRIAGNPGCGRTVGTGRVRGGIRPPSSLMVDLENVLLHWILFHVIAVCVIMFHTNDVYNAEIK